MSATNIHRQLEKALTSNPDRFAWLVLLVGIALRAWEASHSYLNPDEAYFLFRAVPDNFRELYWSAVHTHHPPMVVFLLHVIGRLSDSELALRLFSVIAGGLFPWFVYRWLGEAWNRSAAFLALTLLALAPNIISLSARARGYALVLLFISAALLVLDRAIDRGSIRQMLLFLVLLSTATFAEHLAVFFSAAAGLYFLLRIAWRKAPRNLIVVWACGQVFVLALHVFHRISLFRLARAPGTAPPIEPWIQGAFPTPGHSLVLEFAQGCVKQFAYLFSSVPLGLVRHRNPRPVDVVREPMAQPD